MRLFVPLHVDSLVQLAGDGAITGEFDVVVATPAFAEWIQSDDPEDLACAVLMRAGDLALELAHDYRRVVLVVDAEPNYLEAPEAAPGSGMIGQITRQQIVCIFVDDSSSADAVKAARADAAAIELLDELDLVWFDAQELNAVAQGLA